jgi:DNA repair ATPase RecN
MLLISTSLLSLNPMIDRKKSIIASAEITKQQQYVTKDSSFDLKQTYCYVNNKETKISLLRDFLNTFLELSSEEEIPLSPKVVNKTSDFLDTLSVRVIEQMDMNNIYSTDYSTIVIDFEK